ncbi:polysaccharide deacetylase family sporulation protein PdaB [Gracilibacillus orientalis]|uniref:Polysaccharide deacetylase family sporulation protein PdaB n=1 Tax=Gracilibacillus orientalis TaxID=334253 RepID=A0A1I4JLL3_9BACI|nr:polysaccharide deacetylase family protein [Gracilibacillus orientalis]SFL67083.1 polysaccharide deacetylase family sporulation protein PdaB [Gracilibacillus orientalis]
MQKIKGPLWFVFIILIGVLLFTLIQPVWSSEQTKQTIDQDKPEKKSEIETPVESKHPGLDVVTKTKQANNYTSSITVPTTESSDINDEIHQWLNKQEEEFLNRLDTDIELPEEDYLAHLNIQLETSQITNNVYNLTFQTYQYAGGANGMDEVMPFTIDVKKGKVLKIDDVMDVDEDAKEKIITQLKTTLQEDKDKASFVFFDKIEEVMDKPSDWKWGISKEFFTIYFDEYEVASGAAGAIQVDIPIDDVILHLKDDLVKEMELTEKQEVQKEKVEQEISELDPNGKYVALTFDDGPHPKVTPQILDTLEEHDAKVTFFMLGTQVEYYPTLAKQVAEAGHEIGNHSFNHTDMTKVGQSEIKEEFKDTNELIKEATGMQPTTIRPPYGAYDQNLLTVSEELASTTILWSVDSLDWKSRDADSINKTVINNVDNGAIILMHDIHQPTADALSELLTNLENEGYDFVTVSELLQLHNKKDIGPYYKG